MLQKDLIKEVTPHRTHRTTVGCRNVGGEVRASGSRVGIAAPGPGSKARRDGASQEGGSRTRGVF